MDTTRPPGLAAATVRVFNPNPRQEEGVPVLPDISLVSATMHRDRKNWFSAVNSLAKPNTDNERVYLRSLEYVLKEGDEKSDRTGTGTLSVFGPQAVYDLRKGFPMLTTKKLPWNAIMYELVWFLKGMTNNTWLQERGVRIWNEWANEQGELGPIYGSMWRNFPNPNGEGIDQIKAVLDALFNRPDDRRILVSGWNPALLPEPGVSFADNIANGRQALPPCHTLWQVGTSLIPPKELEKMLLGARRSIYKTWRSDRTLKGTLDPVELRRVCDECKLPTRFIDLKLYQRSGDIFLGVPFNIASYSLLLSILGFQVNMIPRYFIHTFGDLHLYSNHKEQAAIQLERIPNKAPKLLFVNSVPEEVYIPGLFTNLPLLDGYNPHPAIPAPVAV